MIWVSVFYVMGTAHDYAWVESQRCFPAKPLRVERTRSWSTWITWKTIAYNENNIVLPAITLDTLALENRLFIKGGGFC